MKHIKKAKKLTQAWFASGGALLGIGAIISKIFGLLRDRVFLNAFPTQGTTDLLFAAFRIPDFFFFLLISGTVATILIPRLSSQNEQEQTQFISSMVWGIFFGFGFICALAIILTPWLTELLAHGFSSTDKLQITNLSQILFGAIFLMSISSVFGAALQYKKILWPLAITPLIYTLSIILGTIFLNEKYGINAVGYGALIGAFLHMALHLGVFLRKHGTISWTWQEPRPAWKGAKKDFFLRVLNASTMQIAQSIDLLIGSFLLAGSITAFSLGSSAGHILLTIIGISTARAIFPQLAQEKKSQKKIIYQAHQFIWMISIPASVILFFAGEQFIAFLFGVEGEVLTWTTAVFQWTIASLPFACLIPIYTRIFLANNDTRTPLILTAITFIISIGTAAILSLIILPEKSAVIGLGIGNFLTNSLLFLLLFISAHKKYFKNT
jgi:putative peptidoglycan lipid II flippase